jgi:hypothetical protein
MKNLVRSIIILLFPLTAFSQKEYFIYLQSEAEQPFFVRLEDKTYASSPAGYLILSKLKDTTHTFLVGFPQNKWPEQRFTVTIRAKDHGYLLKNFAEKGWGLFNLQTMDVQMAAGSAALKRKNGNSNATVSLFTEILSKAANDPSLTEEPEFAVVRQNTEQAPPANKIESEPVTVKQQVKEQADAPDSSAKTEKLVAKEDSRVKGEQPLDKPSGEPLQKTADSSSTAANKVVNEVDPVVVKDKPKEDVEIKGADKEIEPVKSVALKNATNSLKESPGSDTPAGEPSKKETAEIKTEPVANTPVAPLPSKDYERSEVIKKSESSTTDGFGLTFIDKIGDFRQDTIEIFIPAPKSILTDSRKSSADDKRFLDIRDGDGSKPGTQNAVIKKECSAIASENDFFRLRKKMAGEKESESMINEAKREFKTKCFTIDQIRNLGNLFFNEAGKYQFYEMAYPNSTDKNGFVSLQSELKDPYFVHRFKSLVN